MYQQRMNRGHTLTRITRFFWVFAGIFNYTGSCFCMNADCSISLDISVSGSNVTFTGGCTAVAPVYWCAFGISEDPGGGMVPAEVFMLQPDVTGKIVVSFVRLSVSQFCTHKSRVPHLQYLEDRQNTGFSSPPCMASQVSQLLNYSVNTADGSSSLSATWTRPLILAGDLITDGYVNFLPG